MLVADIFAQSINDTVVSMNLVELAAEESYLAIFYGNLQFEVHKLVTSAATPTLTYVAQFSHGKNFLQDVPSAYVNEKAGKLFITGDYFTEQYRLDLSSNVLQLEVKIIDLFKQNQITLFRRISDITLSNFNGQES